MHCQQQNPGFEKVKDSNSHPHILSSEKNRSSKMKDYMRPHTHIYLEIECTFQKLTGRGIGSLKGSLEESRSSYAVDQLQI